MIQLMMVTVFVAGSAYILFGILVKGLLAPWGTEVVCLPLILGFARRGCGVDIHATHRIFYCICHVNFPFVLSKYYMP